MLKPFLAVAACAALVAPPLAHAGDVSMRVRDVPLAARSLAASAPATPFNMLAAHWVGPGQVRYRVHRRRGRWSAWRLADSDVAPDGGTGRWHDGNLDWTGAADRVQFRISGRIARLRSYELWSRVTRAAARSSSGAGSPAIVPRSGWGADEEIVRAHPRYSSVLRLTVVHHTAGSNAYSRAQAAAIVRGIEVYHVEGNGWDDIGYNLLVDRFGTVYEGRAGGLERAVIGAHAEGFNTGTAGVALMGNYSAATPPRAQQDALVKVLAWRLDVAHIDPLSRVVYTSGGNLKFRAGKVVTLRAVSGHRDTGPSECPGARAYALLPAIARRVSVTGLPKLYSPAVLGTLGNAVRFQARLSSALPWTVTVVDRLGLVVAKGRGRGPLVAWTWSSAAAPKDLYTWTIAAPGIRVASGLLGIGRPVAAPAPVLSLTNLAAAPSVVAPNADGSGDTTTIRFTLGVAAQVTARVLDAGGVTVASILNQSRSAGDNSFTWQGHVLADGRYTLAVTAKAGAKTVTKAATLVVDRTLAGLAASAPVLSPNGDGIDDTVTFSFTLTQNVPVRLDVEQAGVVLSTPFQGQPGTGVHSLSWDGTGNGTRLPDGRYVAVFTVTDGLGEVHLSLPLTLDTTPPALALVDLATLRFALSEPATVTLTVNGATRLVLAEPTGTFAVPFSDVVTGVTAQAQDAGGNLSAVVSG
jgi:flagellar hook assembly protein FlgD